MNSFISRHGLFFLSICTVIIIHSCTKEDPNRHLNLGDWYLQKNLLDEAIMEYREVSRLFSSDHSKLKRHEYIMLSTAHLKLAIVYTKKGWWEYALTEAKRSFDINPNKDCHELINLIEEKISTAN